MGSDGDGEGARQLSSAREDDPSRRERRLGCHSRVLGGTVCTNRRPRGLRCVAIPLAVAVLVPLQAIFTVSASLLAVNTTMQGQRERDEEAARRAKETARADRIRTAYGLMIRAADRATAAVRELMAYPKGRPTRQPPQSLGTITGSSAPTTVVQYPLTDFDLLNGIDSEAWRFYIEGEIALVLEEGPDSPGVKDFAKVWDAYGEAFDLKNNAKVDALYDELLAAIRAFRKFAHEAVQATEAPQTLGVNLGVKSGSLNSKTPL